MKKQESTTIYLFVLLLIGLSVLSLIFKEQFAATFLKQDYGEMPAPSAVVKDELNLGVLSEEKVKALKLNYSIFDDADLNKTQDLLAENFRVNASSMIKTIVNEDGSVTTIKPTFFRVGVGNNNPFIVEKEKE